MDGLPNEDDGCPNVEGWVGANDGPKGFFAAGDGCGRRSCPNDLPKLLGCCGFPKGPGAGCRAKAGGGIEGLPKVEDDCPKLVAGRPSVDD